MLHVQNLRAFYGQTPVLHGVSFAIQPGETVALLGRNGAGRSTTAKALMGLVRCEGSILWHGQQLVGQPPFAVAQQGIAYVAEARDIFPRLSVQQNLLLGQKGNGPWTFDAVYTLFPHLKAREHTSGGVLSGGEQQMLALARALMGNPQLLVIDEPTEGLAPQVVAQVAAALRLLKAQGVAVLLVEQKQALALEVADRVLVMGRGQVVLAATPAQLRANAGICREWLEV
ncbi:high-affinity branched-chain amino acid transport ATP-binding protein LivF [Comamonadaceae bacterium OS-1]|nr:high-affinity branched-chain amino acid transport ATP-binding protein LivF [Comamonadaceae bacterium OS-1]